MTDLELNQHGSTPFREPTRRRKCAMGAVNTGKSTMRVQRLRDRRRRGVRCLVTVEMTEDMLVLVRRGFVALSPEGGTTRDNIAEAIEEDVCG